MTTSGDQQTVTVHRIRGGVPAPRRPREPGRARALRRHRDRRRAGRAVGRLLPAQARAAVRDPGRGRADRRHLAQALGLAAAVHARQARRPGRDEVPGARQLTSRPRTRWATTSRRTRRASSCPSARGTRVEQAVPARRRASSSRRATSSSRPTRWWSRWRATSSDRVPAFARELRPDIVQLHSCDYRNPAQLRDGGVLIVGAGNSGAEIAKELAGTHDDLDGGPRHGRGAVQDRRLRGAAVLVALRVALRLPPRADHQDADGAQGAPEDPAQGDAAHPREGQAARGGRRQARGARGRGPRRPARAGRRQRARRRQRGLVHRLSPRLLLDRSARASTPTASRSTTAAWCRRRPGCTSSGCTFSTRCRRR